jgi:glycosyltransferase involved in cell wall biosynthesis
VFTLFYEPKLLSSRLAQKLAARTVHVSCLNRFTLARKFYRHLLPVLPIVVRSLDVRDFDWVISSSHCVAKGVHKNPRAFHLAYLHAPMRYMWDRFDDYFGPSRASLLVRVIARICRPFLQAWDRYTSRKSRVDVLLANSQFIADQIFHAYGRTAHVVYPFAKLERFKRPRQEGGFYLMVGAFAPYKKTDLAIEAFIRLGLPLKIVGDGQDEARLRAQVKAAGARNIEFLGSPTNEIIEQLYSECKAFIFPGKEDFGITPLEAMASGAPVIAFGEGGASETVTPDTGILFLPQTAHALTDAVMNIESGRRQFSAAKCRDRAAHFTEERFKNDILRFLPDGNYR